MAKRIIYAEDALANIDRESAYLSDAGRIHARAAVNDAPTVDAVALPCRMGDMVWGLRYSFNDRYVAKRGKVFQMFFGEDMRLCISVKNVCRGEWGKNVFATKEEAEAAIRERRTDNA